MSRARSVAIALAAAALAIPAGALAQGSSGAGDAQYGDPFSEEQTSPTTDGSATGGDDSGLTQDPDLGAAGGTGSGSGSTSGSTGSTSAGPAPPGTGPAALPNTGSDPRLIVLAGLALLLSGLGLRLRTADETF